MLPIKPQFKGHVAWVRFIYKVLRYFNVVFWYYYFPFLTFIGSYAVPFMIQEYSRHLTDN